MLTVQSCQLILLPNICICPLLLFFFLIALFCILKCITSNFQYEILTVHFCLHPNDAHYTQHCFNYSNFCIITQHPFYQSPCHLILNKQWSLEDITCELIDMEKTIATMRACFLSLSVLHPCCQLTLNSLDTNFAMLSFVKELLMAHIIINCKTFIKIVH